MRNLPYPYYQVEQAENIWGLLEMAAVRYAGRDAYVFKKGKHVQRKSFEVLHLEAHAFAAFFAAQGLRRERIAILGENSYGWIVAWFGIVLSGNIAVPIDRLLEEDQIAFLLNDTRAKAVVFSRQYDDMIPSTLADGGPLTRIAMEDCLPECIRQGAGLLKSQGKKAVPDDTDKHADALIIYTSGTTGLAKGVVLSQHNLCFDMNSLNQIARFPGSNLFVLPLNHVYAFQGALVFISQGLTTYLSASLKRVAQEMKEYQPFAMCVVPLFIESMHGKIMDSARQQGAEKKLRWLMRLSLRLYAAGIDVRRLLFRRILREFGGNLNTMFCGGAALDPEYIRDFRAFGINVMVGYGITECAPVLCGNRNAHYKDGSVGMPIPGAELRTDAPDGLAEGELLARGPMIMRGYYQNDAATADAFDGEWFKTGDIGYIDKDGFVFITGRKKNIIILSNGKNLYPEELELQLMKLPAVCEVVVCEDDRQVAAKIFPNGEWLREQGVSDVRAYLEDAIHLMNQRLPLYKNITKIQLRTSGFPKTSTQKIRRNLL